MLRRACVILVFYDLSVSEASANREANKFRKDLKRNGYIIIQKSIYAKLLHTDSLAKNEIKRIKEFAPDTGTINVIYLSLAEFKRMVSITGPQFNMSLFADEVVEV